MVYLIFVSFRDDLTEISAILMELGVIYIARLSLSLF